MVNSDCTSSFYCLSRLPDEGASLTCDEGTIVTLNVEGFYWSCEHDTGEICPGLGGYSYGTHEQVEITSPAPSTTPAATPAPEYSINPYGTCSCEGQIVIDSDCSQGFLCTSDIPDPYMYDGYILCKDVESQQLFARMFNQNCLLFLQPAQMISYSYLILALTLLDMHVLTWILGPNTVQESINSFAQVKTLMEISTLTTVKKRVY